MGWQEVLLTLLRVPLTRRQTIIRHQGAVHPEWLLWLPQGAEPSYEVIEKAHDDKAEMVQKSQKVALTHWAIDQKFNWLDLLYMSVHACGMHAYVCVSDAHTHMYVCECMYACVCVHVCVSLGLNYCMQSPEWQLLEKLSEIFHWALDKNTHQGKLLYVCLVTGTFLGRLPLSPMWLLLSGTVQGGTIAIT